MHRPRHARAFKPVSRITHQRSASILSPRRKTPQLAAGQSPARPSGTGTPTLTPLRQVVGAKTAIPTTPTKSPFPVDQRSTLPVSQSASRIATRTVQAQVQVGSHSRTSPAPQLGVTGEQEENDGQRRLAEDRQIRFRVVPVRPRQSPSITRLRVGPATAPRDIGVATHDRQRIRGKDDEVEDVFGSTCTPLYVRSRAQSKSRAKVSGVDVRERVGLMGGDHPGGHEIAEAMADLGAKQSLSAMDPSSRVLGNTATKDRSAELTEPSPAEGQFDDAESDSPARLLLSFASSAYTYTAGPLTCPLRPKVAGAPGSAPVPAGPADARLKHAVLPMSSPSSSTAIAEATLAPNQSSLSPVEHLDQPVPSSPTQSSTLQAPAGGEVPIIGVSADAKRPEVAVRDEANDSQDQGWTKRRKLGPSPSSNLTADGKPRTSEGRLALHGALDAPAGDASGSVRRPTADDAERAKDPAKATRLRHQACISTLIHAVGLGIPLPTSSHPRATPCPTPLRFAWPTSLSAQPNAPRTYRFGPSGQGHRAAYSHCALFDAEHTDDSAVRIGNGAPANFGSASGTKQHATEDRDASGSRAVTAERGEAEGDVSVDMELPRTNRPGASGPAFGFTFPFPPGQTFSSINGSTAVEDAAPPAAEHAQNTLAHQSAQTLLVENETLRGEVRATKRKLADLSSLHLASLERIVALQSEIQHLRPAPLPTQTAQTQMRIQQSQSQSQYEAYEAAVRLADARTSLLTARSRIAKLEQRERVAREDAKVYRERARLVEEEMRRMGEERDREVRCMMDAMAERGMLSRYEEAYHASRPASSTLGNKRSRSARNAAEARYRGDSADSDEDDDNDGRKRARHA